MERSFGMSRLDDSGFSSLSGLGSRKDLGKAVWGRHREGVFVRVTQSEDLAGCAEEGSDL